MAGQTDEGQSGSTMAGIKEMNESGNPNGVTLGHENGAADPAAYAYRPEGRRDPFLAIVQDANKAVEVNLNVPPLQRVNLSEITLIGILWGGFGYIGMVQTPDGRGYAVREGTNVGSNEGVVRLITAEGLIVKEPYVDVVGRKEIREHVIPLHPKINNE
jgi:type IV pilus assembly protein PilP